MRTCAPRGFRPALETLEAREVPAAFTWTGAVSTDATVAANWSSLEEPGGLPGEDDHLYFDATVSIGIPGSPPSPGGTSVNCDNLQSLGSGFAGVHIGATYTGTVTTGEALTFGVFDLANGAISQSASAYDLSVTGTFNWTGGTLNSTPSAAAVYLNGGGTITLPGGTNTLTTGSTLSFGSSSGEKLTTISGGGDLLLNGTGDGIFVNADAKVNTVVQVGSPNAVKGVNNATKVLTLSGGAYWGYTGQGSATLGLRVTNSSGIFYLRDQASVAIKGEQNDVDFALSWGYSQGNVNANDPSLQITNGCVLDVSATKGTSILSGRVQLVGNSALTAQQQVATIKGKFEFRGGTIGFHQTPTQIGDTLVWGHFKVEGDVLWAGGVFQPGLDCRQPGPGLKLANKWIITGTLTLDKTNPDKPTIAPVPQFLPQGQQIAGQYSLIEAAQIVGGAPAYPADWTLVTASKPDGTITGYGLQK